MSCWDSNKRTRIKRWHPGTLKEFSQKDFRGYSSCVFILHHTELFLNPQRTKPCVSSCITSWQSSSHGACVLDVIWIFFKKWEKAQISEYVGKAARSCSHLAQKGTELWSETQTLPGWSAAQPKSFLPCVPSAAHDLKPVCSELDCVP